MKLSPLQLPLLFAVVAAACSDPGSTEEGAGGAPGGGGVTCSDPAGEAKVLYELPAGPDFVAHDAEFLYFFAGGLTRAAKDGSGMALVPLTDDDDGSSPPTGRVPSGLAVDGTHVYWAVGSSVFRAPKAGGEIENVFTVQGDLENYARELVVDDTHAYWVDSGCCGVYRAPKDQLTASGETLVDSRIDPVHLAIDDSHVYWEGRGSLLRALKDGTEASTIYTGTAGIHGIQVDGSALYWVEFGGRVMRAGKDGSAPEELVPASGGGARSNLRQDATDLFVAGGGGVVRVAKDGSSTESWSSTAPSPTNDAAADATAVYWVTGMINSGAVVRVCR